MAVTFRCPLCGDQNFASKHERSQHLQGCTGTLTKPHLCKYCNLRLFDQKCLAKHQATIKCAKTRNTSTPSQPVSPPTVSPQLVYQCHRCGQAFGGQKAYHAHQDDSTLECSPNYIAPAVLRPTADALSSITAAIQRNPSLFGSVTANGDGALVAKDAVVPPSLDRILDKVLYRTYMCAEASTGVNEMRAYLGEGAARLLLALTLDVSMVEQCGAAHRADDFRSIEKIAPVECELPERDYTSDWTLSLCLILSPNDPEYVRLCVDKSQSKLMQAAWQHEVQKTSFPGDCLWYNIWSGLSRQAYFVRLGKVDQRWFANSHACEAWSDVVKETLCVYLRTYQQFDLAEYGSAVATAPGHGLNMAMSRFEMLLHIDSTDATILTASEDPEKQAYGFTRYQNHSAGRYQVKESFITLVRKRLIRQANPHLGDAAFVRTRCAACRNLRTDYEPYYEDQTGFYVTRRMPCRYCARTSEKTLESHLPKTVSSDLIGSEKGTVSEETLLKRIQRAFDRHKLH